MEISTVACVGSGIIGRSWACVFARSANRVWLYDPQRSALEQARGKIRQFLDTSVTYGLLESANLAFDRIFFTTDLNEAIAEADYVQENAPEDLRLKTELFQSLDRLASSHALLASSTSEFPASAFMNGLSGRSRCLVVHPLNPPHLIPAVEISPAPFTSSETIAKTVELMRAVGQKPALINQEVKGFVMNRLQIAVLREALSLVHSEKCSVNDIDLLMKYGLGLRWATMGPFETNFLSTAQGYTHFLQAYGKTLASVMSDLASDYVGTEALGRRIDAELATRFDATDHASVEEKRDHNLARILAASLRP